MAELLCADIRQWLLQAASTDGRMVPQPALCEHVAGCSLCRGALALVALGALGLPAIPEVNTEEHFVDDLAAFIDNEIEEGTLAAIRMYPHVWWHLWTCTECVEVYHITHSVLESEQAKKQHSLAVDPVQISSIWSRQRVLKLGRPALHRALAPSSPAGVTRGNTGVSYVLAEEEFPEQYLTISVRRQPNNEWAVDVAVKPPPSGWLLLMLGSVQYRVRFNDQGNAVVPDVPYSLLTSPDGPDLEVGLELDADQT